MDIQSKFNMEDALFMGFVTEGKCGECGKPTFAADEICAQCKLEMAEDDRRFFDENIIDCE